MCSSQIIMSRATLGPHLILAKSCINTWKMVEYPHCICNCKWPKMKLRTGWPMIDKMDHIGTSPGCNSLNVAFSHTILVLGSNATEIKLLLLCFTITSKFFRCKSSIVGMILFDLETFTTCKILKFALANNSLGSIIQDLTEVEDFSVA